MSEKTHSRRVTGYRKYHTTVMSPSKTHSKTSTFGLKMHLVREWHHFYEPEPPQTPSDGHPTAQVSKSAQGGPLNKFKNLDITIFWRFCPNTIMTYCVIL